MLPILHWYFWRKAAYNNFFNFFRIFDAGNGYFGQKKNKYKDSPIANVNDLSKYPSDDWVKTDIEAREKLFLESIVGFFHSNLHKK